MYRVCNLTSISAVADTCRSTMTGRWTFTRSLALRLWRPSNTTTRGSSPPMPTSSRKHSCAPECLSRPPLHHHHHHPGPWCHSSRVMQCPQCLARLSVPCCGTCPGDNSLCLVLSFVRFIRCPKLLCLTVGCLELTVSLCSYPGPRRTLEGFSGTAFPSAGTARPLRELQATRCLLQSLLRD